MARLAAHAGGFVLTKANGTVTMVEALRAAGSEAVWLSENVFRAGLSGVDDAARALSKNLVNLEELK